MNILLLFQVAIALSFEANKFKIFVVENLNEDGSVLVDKFNLTESQKTKTISNLLKSEKISILSIMLQFIILMLSLPIMVFVIFILFKLYQHTW